MTAQDLGVQTKRYLASLNPLYFVDCLSTVGNGVENRREFLTLCTFCFLGELIVDYLGTLRMLEMSRLANEKFGNE